MCIIFVEDPTMKKPIIILSVISLLLTGCWQKKDDNSADQTGSAEAHSEVENEFDEKELQQIKDQVYAELNDQFASDEYQVQDVKVIYLTEDEVNNLSPEDKAYFGYSANGLNDVITSDMTVIDQSDTGSIDVRSEKLLDKEDRTTVIKNLSVGGGVILVDVTVAWIVSEGKINIDNQTITAIIALAPKASAIGAGVLSVITGTVSGIIAVFPIVAPVLATRISLGFKILLEFALFTSSDIYTTLSKFSFPSHVKF